MFSLHLRKKKPQLIEVRVTLTHGDTSIPGESGLPGLEDVKETYPIFPGERFEAYISDARIIRPDGQPRRILKYRAGYTCDYELIYKEDYQ